MANTAKDTTADAAAQAATDAATDAAATADAAAGDAAPTLPAGDALGWTDPADAAADVADVAGTATDVELEPVVDHHLPFAVEVYVFGLEAELAMFGDDPERKAAIVAELDRVRGGKAIDGTPKETR